MQWFDTNPAGPKAGIAAQLRFEAHEWGRRAFASNYARGGFAATAFAPTSTEALVSPWRRTHRYGSYEHRQNLRRIQKTYPEDLNIKKSLDKMERAGSKSHLAGRLFGAAMMGAFVALPAFTTPGGPAEKFRATVGGAAGFLGWEVGAKAGMGIGAMLGGPIGAGVGWLAGGFLGAVGFDEGARALLRIPDRMVDRERARRNLNWVGDTTAFATRGAATMRQQSLQAMNRGMMTARSMLGREGVMVHQ